MVFILDVVGALRIAQAQLPWFLFNAYYNQNFKIVIIGTRGKDVILPETLFIVL